LIPSSEALFVLGIKLNVQAFVDLKP